MSPKVLLLPALLLCLMLNGKEVESKQYMRCELTRVLVETYRFQKSLMSNCKYSTYVYTHNIIINSHSI